MKITVEMLKAIAPYAPKSVDVFVPYLNKAFEAYEINTPERAAMFLAQTAHESGSFRYTKEIANGVAYEMRADLGNVIFGDGQKYKGRGLIQLTGRTNYKVCGDALKIDLITHPSLLETPQYAVMSAAWFWQKNGLNELADTKDIIKCTKRINGGTNGLAARKEFYNKALNVLAHKRIAS